MKYFRFCLFLLFIVVVLSSCSAGSTGGSSYNGNGGSSGNSSSGSGGGSNNGNSGSGGTSSNGSNSSSGVPNWGVQTKTTGCQVQGPLQDKACTPGAIFKDATKEQICTPGYARSVRDVPTSVKNQVYASYGIASRKPGEYEVDHLVSLQLGGSNDIANLWPEAALPKPGFHEKDQVENYLHDQMCSGAMTVLEAQTKIATNWLDVYEHMPKKGQ